MLEHFRGNEDFAKRILDLMEQAKRQQRLLITPFLTPQEVMIAKHIIGSQLQVEVDGGYDDAQMCRLGICPYTDAMDLEVQIVKATYRNMGYELTHRDVLGALMQLGMRRNQFGDILVNEDEIYLVVKSDSVDYICREFIKIARYSICFECYYGKLQSFQRLTYTMHSLSSMRLDCIVAACIKGSRNKAEATIKGKLVKVNHMPLEDCKCLCNNNSTISIRGFGRFVIKENGKRSKKGRIVVEIGKYV